MKIRIHAFKMGDFNTSFVQHLRRWFDVCCAIIFQLHPPGVYERTKETCARRPRLHLGCRYLCKIKVQQKYHTKIRNFPSSRLIMDGFFSLIWRKFDPFRFSWVGRPLGCMAIPHPRGFSYAIAQRSTSRVAQKLTELAKAKGLFGARYGTSTYLAGAMGGSLRSMIPRKDTL